ncbi:MAG: nicotinate (nicotinamide) nucleotide adenylyltransferase [Candidatus Cloacimonetes bacterium]|nr:nicotinate (nicotinamide) nucleotide adenylyltransferase [Candidatus Cloacimonadota bacterium]
MKIGLLGGSFNPIHNGHIALANEAYNTLNLDKILFLPSGNHPLKRNDEILPFGIRFKLIEKVLDNYPDFEASNLDSQYEDLSYTDELIKRLKKQFPDDEFFFIVGTDIIKELPLWHNWHWLLNNVNIVVANRPDTNKTTWKNLDYLNKLNFIEMKPVDVSSSMIRDKIKRSDSISGLVPEEVEKEICRLYS